MSLRISDDERCLFCTTSSQAYRLGDADVEGGEEQLEILWSSCLECGFAVPTSRHEAGELLGDYPRALAALESGSPHLILPSEAIVYFHPATPEQLVNACRAAGFGNVHFELLGDELVAGEYLRIWKEEGDDRTWIRSTNPIVVEYVRLKHPELLPYMAPIVTPPIALARNLHARHPEADIVYAGLTDPGGTEDDRDSLIPISFEGLAKLFSEREAEPSSRPSEHEGPVPPRQRHLSVAGGLPRAMLEGERMASRNFRKIRELAKLASIARMIRDEDDPLGFIDVLPFEGALDHPVLGPDSELLWRQRIAELAETSRSDEPVIEKEAGADLSIVHQESDRSLPRVKLDDVVDTLATLGIQANEVFTQDDRHLVMCPFYLGRQYEKAVKDARHDALTGLYSYGTFKQRFEEEVARANREGSGVALLLVDLDDFKTINDEHGHAVGNEVLHRTARVLQASVRHTDVVARFGGDEMVVILVNPDREGAFQVAEKIRAQIAAIQIDTGQGEIGFTASIGIAHHSGRLRSAQTSKDLFAEADASLYIAKARGGNRIYPFAAEEQKHP